MRLQNGEMHDLSKVRVQGLYVLDMIAHNNDRDRDVFQIAPGTGGTRTMAGLSSASGQRPLERRHSRVEQARQSA